jgi:NAD(P)H-dependent flavin oxidoreductase YrpB (nitropropane dioxygenase family)
MMQGEEGFGLTVPHVNGALLFPDDMPFDRTAAENAAAFDADFAPMLAGQAIGGVRSVQTTEQIIEAMVSGAVRTLREAAALVSRL